MPENTNTNRQHAKSLFFVLFLRLIWFGEASSQIFLLGQNRAVLKDEKHPGIQENLCQVSLFHFLLLNSYQEVRNQRRLVFVAQ